MTRRLRRLAPWAARSLTRAARSRDLGSAGRASNPLVYRYVGSNPTTPSGQIGGEGGIRTHVPELPDHPISNRRRYDHFGTSPHDLQARFRCAAPQMPRNPTWVQAGSRKHRYSSRT